MFRSNSPQTIWFGPKPWLGLCLIAVLFSHGCASFFAKQAIDQFALGLEEQDLGKLKQTTSSDFQQKALRQPEAVNDLKLLRVPTDSIEVVSVTQVDKTTKKVVVKVGEDERAKEMEYQLTHNRDIGKWVVNDVVLAQQGIGDQKIRRTVSEQMDLLLTCREFLAAWKDGQRTEKLAHCTGELRDELEVLPPNWLEVLSERIVGTGRQRTFRPEARLSGEKAVVIVPHPDGDLFIELKQVASSWKVDNLAIEPKTDSDTDTGISSLTKLVKALNQSAHFLTSYASHDREGLEDTASDDFYKQCLSAADLDAVELPVPALLADNYEMRQFKDRMEMLLNGPDGTYMLTLIREEAPMVDGIAGEITTRVDEVTIFENANEEVKKLSAMYLSHAVVNIYLEALANRDVEQLRELSSANFKERVWDREFARHFSIMNYPSIDDGEMDIISTVFQGDLTEVTITRGQSAMTFIMKLANGWMVVDDVQMPAIDRPSSLKSNLELVLPLRSFAAAIQRRDLKASIRESGDGLDRIVWMQRNEFPELQFDLVRPMMGEVISIEPSDAWVVVRTSDGDTMAEVKLTQEANRYVVHDVSLVNEHDTNQRVELIQNMRDAIAASQQPQRLRQSQMQHAQAIPQPRPAQKIMQAQYTEVEEPQPLEPTPRKIQQTGFEPISRDLYTE